MYRQLSIQSNVVCVHVPPQCVSFFGSVLTDEGVPFSPDPGSHCNVGASFSLRPPARHSLNTEQHRYQLNKWLINLTKIIITILKKLS